MMDPVETVFYGGPWHARKQVVGQSSVAVNSTIKKPKLKYVPGITASNNPNSQVFFAPLYKTEVYAWIALADVQPYFDAYGTQRGYIRESARCMAISGRKYDSQKIWNMMKRYKCMPYYKREVVDFDGRILG